MYFWYIFAVYLVTLVGVHNAQRWQSNSVSSSWNSLDSARDSELNVEVPGISSSASIQLVKQVPYIETLKLVQSFLKLKGEMASRFWGLISDNSHILAALRDTLIVKISTIHNFTLSLIIILRKILEFAASLFGNANVSAAFSFG